MATKAKTPATNGQKTAPHTINRILDEKKANIISTPDRTWGQGEHYE
jgi:hypothetical protein